jgi:hypothetical protein
MVFVSSQTSISLQTGENNEIQPLQFRYSISPKSKVNAFKPKPVDPAVDVRYSMLGG